MRCDEGSLIVCTIAIDLLEDGQGLSTHLVILDTGLDNFGIRLECDEGKAATHGIVDRSCRSVGRVHRADNIKVGGYREGILGVGKRNCDGVYLRSSALICFEERDQLSEDT